MTLPAFLYDIGTFLQTSGIGTLGVDIHYRGFDEIAENDIALFPVAGRGHNNAVSPADIVYYPSLKILVRNTDGDTAESKAFQIYNLLTLITNRTLGATRIKRIESPSTPWFVSVDDNGSTIYSIDFDLELQ